MFSALKKSRYIKDIEATATIDAIRATFPRLGSLAAHLPIPMFTEAVKAHQRVLGYTEESINHYYNLLASDPSRARLTVFTKVFQAKEEETLTFREIRNNAAAFIIAGSNTTANTLTYAVWCICRHPQVKARLINELSALPDDFTDDHLRDLSYLKQVIKVGKCWLL
jgi:cytochrome P450